MSVIFYEMEKFSIFILSCSLGKTLIVLWEHVFFQKIKYNLFLFTLLELK